MVNASVRRTAQAVGMERAAIGGHFRMWDTISGYIFFIFLGLLSLGLAGWLLVTGAVVQSIDNLFLVLVCGLFAVVCFWYLGWRISEMISTNDKK